MNTIVNDFLLLDGSPNTVEQVPGYPRETAMAALVDLDNGFCRRAVVAYNQGRLRGASSDLSEAARALGFDNAFAATGVTLCGIDLPAQRTVVWVEGYVRLLLAELFDCIAAYRFASFHSGKRRAMVQILTYRADVGEFARLVGLNRGGLGSRPKGVTLVAWLYAQALAYAKSRLRTMGAEVWPNPNVAETFYVAEPLVYGGARQKAALRALSTDPADVVVFLSALQDMWARTVKDVLVLNGPEVPAVSDSDVLDIIERIADGVMLAAPISAAEFDARAEARLSANPRARQHNPAWYELGGKSKAAIVMTEQDDIRYRWRHSGRLFLVKACKGLVNGVGGKRAMVRKLRVKFAGRSIEVQEEPWTVDRTMVEAATDPKSHAARPVFVTRVGLIVAHSLWGKTTLFEKMRQRLLDSGEAVAPCLRRVSDFSVEGRHTLSAVIESTGVGPVV